MLKSVKKRICNWFYRFHKFSKDYEYLAEISKSMIYNDMIDYGWEIS
jgi:hypothetical protein